MTKWNKKNKIYIYNIIVWGWYYFMCICFESWFNSHYSSIQLCYQWWKQLSCFFFFFCIKLILTRNLITSNWIGLCQFNKSFNYSFCSVADRAFRQLGQHRQVHSASSAAEPGSSRALWTEAPEEGRLHGAGRSLQFCPKACRDPGMAYWDPRPDEQPWKWALFIYWPQQ